MQMRSIVLAASLGVMLVLAAAVGAAKPGSGSSTGTGRVFVSTQCSPLVTKH